jgi:type II secretory pathway pseudopilin PulG
MVELLIVIAILALLAALLLAGIARVQSVGRVATVNNDITQLAMSCDKFKQDFGFYPPSVFRLPAYQPPAVNPAANALEQQIEANSFNLLKTMYPRWNPTVNAAGQIQDWTANGMAPIYLNQNLNGNQTMVLLLGGPGNTGWAVDRPWPPTAGATTVKGPYFDFKQDRLVPGIQLPAPYTLANNPAPAYMDAFRSPANGGLGTPYAYFGSSSPGGKYLAVPCWGVMPFVEQANNPPTVPTGVVVKYLNQGTVQIICAGEDNKFGPGCPLVGTVQCIYQAGRSGSPYSAYAEGDDGADDIGNFNSGNKLGVGR